MTQYYILQYRSDNGTTIYNRFEDVRPDDIWLLPGFVYTGLFCVKLTREHRWNERHVSSTWWGIPKTETK